MVSLREALRLVIAMAATVATTYFLTMHGCGRNNKPGNTHLLSLTGSYFAMMRIVSPLFKSNHPLFLDRVRACILDPNRVHSAIWLATVLTSVLCTKYYHIINIMGRHELSINIDVILVMWVASLAAEIVFKHSGLVSGFQYGWVQYLFWVWAWLTGLVARGPKFPLNFFSFIINGFILVITLVCQLCCGGDDDDDGDDNGGDDANDGQVLLEVAGDEVLHDE